MTARYHTPETPSNKGARRSGRSKLFRVDDSLDVSLEATATALNLTQNSLANVAIGSFLALPDKEKLAVIDRYYSGDTRETVRNQYDDAISKLAGKKKGK